MFPPRTTRPSAPPRTPLRPRLCRARLRRPSRRARSLPPPRALPRLPGPRKPPSRCFPVTTPFPPQSAIANGNASSVAKCTPTPPLPPRPQPPLSVRTPTSPFPSLHSSCATTHTRANNNNTPQKRSLLTVATANLGTRNPLCHRSQCEGDRG